MKKRLLSVIIFALTLTSYLPSYASSPHEMSKSAEEKSRMVAHNQENTRKYLIPAIQDNSLKKVFAVIEKFKIEPAIDAPFVVDAKYASLSEGTAYYRKVGTNMTHVPNHVPAAAIAIILRKGNALHALAFVDPSGTASAISRLTCSDNIHAKETFNWINNLQLVGRDGSIVLRLEQRLQSSNAASNQKK